MVKFKIWRISRKSKKYWKDSYKEGNKYSLQFRNDFLVRKIKSLMKSLNIELVVKGYENLPTTGPCMLYGNHQDNFDALAIIVALAAQTEAKDDLNKIATFIAKHSLQYKSYTRYPLNCLDTFYLERDDLKKSLETMDKFSKFVKENKTYGVIFPEGTRNKEGGISEFKGGSFRIAKKEFIPIVPFTINNSVGGFDLKRKEKLIVEVIFHKKISAHSFSTQTTVALAERVQKIVESAFIRPQYNFVENKKEKDIEQSKAAIKWRKKEAKKAKKEAKIERNKRNEEARIVKAQQKEDEKFEKAMEKRERKQKNK